MERTRTKLKKTDEFKIAVISLTATDNRAKNIENALALVTAAAREGAQWVQLPEMWAFMGPYPRLYEMAESQDGPLNEQLGTLAKKLKIVLFAGSVGERPQDHESSAAFGPEGYRKVFNTSYVFNRSGEMIAKYRKVHLFNLLGDQGQLTHKESDGFLQGSTITTVLIDGLKVGMSICYDLRFGEFYSTMEKKFGPVDVIVAPSAFTKLTGLAHWELLLRARAVEFQSYVYAANQVGCHSEGKESYGHGMVVDPWGVVLADTSDVPGMVLASIDPKKISGVRNKLPALANRRVELYR
jgi:predicted amidohydrolase